MDLTTLKAVEFSIVTITTLGYGNIHAEPGSLGAIAASIEAMIGVFFLGLIVSTAIGRAKSLTNQDSSPKQSTLQDTCIALLTFHGYADDIKKLSNALSGNLWIVGGWVRNSALHLEYSGDIDCLTTHEPKDLDILLRNAGYELDTNRFGTRRLLLPDGNHIDLGTTREQANTLDIVAALKNFNFSINAAGVNYSSCRSVYSELFAKDVRDRKFHITCDTKLRSGEFEIGVLKDMEVLEQYYGLEPAYDEKFSKLNERRASITKHYSSLTFEQAMTEATSYLVDLIPDGTQAWIVRGYPRCAYFGEIRYWDDIDVIVSCRREELVQKLNGSNHQWALNYFRNPKVFHPSGITFDIWTLTDNQTIHEVISEFPHNVDSLAWPVNGDKLVADKLVLQSLDNRILRINISAIERMNKFDSSYAAIKSVYLAVRHKLEVESSVADLLSREFQETPLMKKYAISLVKELRICGIKEIFDVTEYIRKTCGDNKPTSYILKLWESPIWSNQ